MLRFVQQTTTTIHHPLPRKLCWGAAVSGVSKSVSVSVSVSVGDVDGVGDGYHCCCFLAAAAGGFEDLRAK